MLHIDDVVRPWGASYTILSEMLKYGLCSFWGYNNVDTMAYKVTIST